MNDSDLNFALRESMERQALSAPLPDGLLAATKQRLRRRRIRDGSVGGVAAAALAVGLVFGGQAMLTGNAGASDGSIAASPGPSSEAVEPEESSPPGFEDGEELSNSVPFHNVDVVDVCLSYDDDEFVEFSIVERVDGEYMSGMWGQTTPETPNADGILTNIEYMLNDSQDSSVRMTLEEGALDEPPAEDTHTFTTADGHEGLIGVDASTQWRTLRVESGVSDVLVRIDLNADENVVSESELISWPDMLDFHADSEPCQA